MNRKRAFVRYDVKGKVVSGSLILVEHMPKLGTWREVDMEKCCTTTTTTNLLCECDSVLTVGTLGEGLYGYASGEGGFGRLNPNCQNVSYLIWGDINPLGFVLGLASDTCCPSAIVEVNGSQYILLFDNYSGGNCNYILYDVPNPFPALGQTCTVKICNTQCTTTTQLPITTTTTTTCIPEGTFVGSYPDMSVSYTPTVGDVVNFSGSLGEACDAVDVVEGQGGEFIFFSISAYSVDDSFFYYYTGTCTLIEDGFYTEFNGEGYNVMEFTGGEFAGQFQCSTTTTSTSSTTTTTTTQFVCNDILLNSGFESWSGDPLNPDDWIGEGIQQESEIVHSGLYSVLLPELTDIVQQVISTNTCLSLDFWYNTQYDNCLVFQISRIIGGFGTILQDDGSWNGDYWFTLPSTGGLWRNYILDFSTVNGEQHTIMFQTTEDGSAYIDDVQLCDQCEPTTTTTTTTTEFPN